MSIEINTPSTSEEANAEINRLTSIAYSALNAATEIATKFDLYVNFDLAYGMGGSFDPDEGEWISSSANC